MNEELEFRISRYLDGDLDAREAAELEKLMERDAEVRETVETFRRVGGKLRALGETPEIRSSEISVESIMERVARREAEERRAVFRLRIAAVAAAAAIAVLLVAAFGSKEELGTASSPLKVSFALAFDYKAPDSRGWSPIPEHPGELAPGTVLRAAGPALLRFPDGSSISASDGTVLVVGSSAAPGAVSLLKGKLTVDVHSGPLSIATQPAVFVCSGGVFEVQQDNPYRFEGTGVGAVLPRPWQWVATLAVHSGVVECNGEYFAESDCRVWAFNGPAGVQAAMLEDALEGR